ncbi:MAG: hypothetical protein ACM3US_09810 [Sphingomonadaceae bacterium]
MGIDPELLALMTETVAIEPRTGVNAYGEALYGAAVQYKARIVGRIRRVTDSAGSERVSTKTITLGAAAVVSPFDRLTLPDGSRPVILAVGSYPDESGAHHTVLYT